MSLDFLEPGHLSSVPASSPQVWALALVHRSHQFQEEPLASHNSPRCNCKITSPGCGSRSPGTCSQTQEARGGGRSRLPGGVSILLPAKGRYTCGPDGLSGSSQEFPPASPEGPAEAGLQGCLPVPETSFFLAPEPWESLTVHICKVNLITPTSPNF